MPSDLSDFVSGCAEKALVFEAAVTPKPGLVDKADSGSHRDMTYALLQKSAAAISPFFGKCALTAFENAHLPASEVFPLLKKIGLLAEKEMLLKTRGINTHKGAIFCFSLLSGAYGYLSAKSQSTEIASILSSVSSLCSSHMEKELAEKKVPVTNGEKAWQEKKLSNARTEAMRGYPSVSENALLKMRYALQKGMCMNDAGVYTLLSLIAQTDDTCLYARGGSEGLLFAKAACRKALEESDFLKAASALNQRFIQRNLSPGGSADLLAATVFLMLITREIGEEKL